MAPFAYHHGRMTDNANCSAAGPVSGRDWRARCTVLLIGHGSTRSTEALAVLERHAETLRHHHSFEDVRAAALFGNGGLGQRLDRLGDPVFVVPMFMADGFTVRTALPAALGEAGFDAAAAGRRVVRCAPVGLSAGVAELIVAKGLAAASSLRIPPADLALLLCAHGSEREPGSAEAAELQAGRVRATGLFRMAAAAYLEQSPLIADSLRTAVAPLAVVGLFSGGSQHATRDVDEAIAAAPAARALDVGAIGCDERMADVIADVVVQSHAAAAR